MGYKKAKTKAHFMLLFLTVSGTYAAPISSGNPTVRKQSTNRPKTRTRIRTRVVTNTIVANGELQVRGYPSGPHFTKYNWNQSYMAYLIAMVKRPINIFPGQRERLVGFCISFGASEDDDGRLEVTSSPGEDTPGSTFKSPPYGFKDTLNFHGNALFTSSRVRLIFEGPTSAFGDRLTLAQQLNSSSTSRDAQSSQLLTNLLTRAPRINTVQSEMVVNNAELDGNLFSFADLVIYSGEFKIANADFLFEGNAEVHRELAPSNLSLQGVQSVATNSAGNRTRIEIIATGSSNLRLNGINQTLTENFSLNSGTYSFTGRTVEMDTCSLAQPFPLWGTIAIAAALVGFFALLSFLYSRGMLSCGMNFTKFLKKRKERDENPPPYQEHVPKEPMSVVAIQSDAHCSYTPPKVVPDEELEAWVAYFLHKYPLRSQQALEAARQSANIPPHLYSSPVKITFIQPRIFDEFAFVDPQPVVSISIMEPSCGIQRVNFATEQICTIQTNAPLLPIQISEEWNGTGPEVYEYLYHVRLLRKPNPDTAVGVGFASCPYPAFSFPGWHQNSIAYHSDEGAVFLNDSSAGRACGPVLNIGDVLSVGYRIQALSDGYYITFFFLHNQQKLPLEVRADTFYPSMLYPTIGSNGEAEVEVTFGSMQNMFFPS
jgi:hypothetical protein